MRPLYLHGLGHFHPENVIDNALLEGLDIGTNQEWILERVGIRERRTVLPLDYLLRTRNADVRAGQEAALYTNAETGRRAALHALERAGLQPKDIGMVVAGGCVPEMAIPAEAARIARPWASRPRPSTSTPPAPASGPSSTCCGRWRACRPTCWW